MFYVFIDVLPIMQTYCLKIMRALPTNLDVIFLMYLPLVLAKYLIFKYFGNQHDLLDKVEQILYT